MTEATPSSQAMIMLTLSGIQSGARSTIAESIQSIDGVTADCHGQGAEQIIEWSSRRYVFMVVGKPIPETEFAELHTGRPISEANAELIVNATSSVPLLVAAGLLVGVGMRMGAGWGLGGFCPGPALASLSYGGWQVALFCAAMVVGMGLHNIALAPKAARA